MTIFGRLDRITSRTCDRVNAIPFTLLPVEIGPNGRPVADPARPTVSGRGILDEVPAEVSVDIGPRDRSHDLRTTLTGTRTELSVDRRVFPRSEMEPRRDDWVEVSGRRWRISSIERDGLSRIVLVLAG